MFPSSGSMDELQRSALSDEQLFAMEGWDNEGTTEPNLGRSRSIQGQGQLPVDDNSMHDVLAHQHGGFEDMKTSGSSVFGGVYDPGSAVNAGREALALFLLKTQCVQLIPESTKIVVLDCDLPVFSAFRALQENRVKSAPVWDSSAGKNGDFIGMVTVSDFIGILMHLRHQNSHLPMLTHDQLLDTLKLHRIRDWRNILQSTAEDRRITKKSLIYASSDDSLYACVRLLLEHSIHRLPILDQSTNNILYIATHYGVLHHTMAMLSDDDRPPALFNATIRDLNILPPQSQLVCVNESQTLIEGLEVLHRHRLSAAPVVLSTSGECIGVCSRSDVLLFIDSPSSVAGAAQGANMLCWSILDVVNYKRAARNDQTLDAVHTCRVSETLERVITKLLTARVYRLVVVDEETGKIPVGVLALGDLMKFFVVDSEESPAIINDS